MNRWKRREFLTGTAAACGALLTSGLTFAQLPKERAARMVCVIMRGALDGLAAVAPVGDPDYAPLRRELALRPAGSPQGGLPLDRLFVLHPALGFLHDCFTARELLVFHAVASPYRERSHFDGQDVLESGAIHPHALQTGWLNRALACLQEPGTAPRELGLALGQNVPLVMRGAAPVTSWSPSRLAMLDEETLQRISDLYAADPVLAARLADAVAMGDVAAMGDVGAMGDVAAAGDGMSHSTLAASHPKADRYDAIVRAAAGFLRREAGPNVAVFDTSGWDTHANEGDAQGQLAARLGALDSGLRTLKEALGPVWSDTAVLLATEFGRTAAINGTRGTDHGTGTAAFLLGGAVRGGRVLADWPGLANGSLYQGRDLAPTTDLRCVLKGVLTEHLRVSSAALERSVFPDSRAAKPLRDLIRT